MFSSISAIVSFTLSPAVFANVMKLSRWAGVLIASPKVVNVSLNGALWRDKNGEQKVYLKLKLQMATVSPFIHSFKVVQEERQHQASLVAANLDQVFNHLKCIFL